MKIIFFFRHPDVGHSIHRVFRTTINELKLNKSLDIDTFNVKSKGSLPNDVLKNIIYAINNRDKKSIHHVTGHIHDILLGLVGFKTILTIHDLVFLDNVKNPIKRFYKWLFWLYLPLKIADVVVCISNETKTKILAKVKSKKLKVIYNPIDPIFTTSLKKFNQKKPVVLHIGTGWNKNLNRSIIALEGINCHLRIIGKLTPLQEELLTKHKVEFSNECNLSDEEINLEYQNCDIVNFPSEYEGFGMPVIEAQKTGRVVLTSNIEPIIEVSNHAAHLVDPKNIASIRAGYVKLIQDEKYRRKLIEKGIENSLRFSVEKISKEYLKVYKELTKK